MNSRILSIANRVAIGGVLSGMLWGGVGVPSAFGQGTGDVETSDTGVKQITLVVGDQKILTLPYAYGDVSLANSNTVGLSTAFRARREILLNGLRPGSNSLIIFDTRGNRRDEYEIQILSENLSKAMNSLKSLLGDIEGLRYRVVGEKIIIEGEVFLDDEMRRIEQIASKNPNVMQLVTLSPVTLRITASTIEKEIGRPDITARPLKDQIMLEGTVYSETAKARAEAISRAYYAKIINVLDVRQSERPPSRDKTIVLIAHYVNLSKSLLNSWGFQWTPLATGQEALVSGEFGGEYDIDDKTLTVDPVTFTGQASILLPKIERAKTSGYARVLENPTVSVKSGEPVSMFSGLQYPYPTTDNLGNVSIEWKNIGIQLDATPYAQGDSVDMKMKIEVTDLGQLANSNGDPAIDTSRIETRQYCKAGESIVIGGLARLSDSVLYNKTPDAVDGALLQLFKSKAYNKAKNQFLVFITPQIHETSTTANKEIQEKFNLKEVKQ